MNEEADAHYNREFLANVFEAESDGLYDVRSSALGHLQQGGAPSPYDRLLATRLVFAALGELDSQFLQGRSQAVYIGDVGNTIQVRPVDRMFDDLDMANRRPFDQWWRDLRPILTAVSMQSQPRELEPVTIMQAESFNH